MEKSTMNRWLNGRHLPAVVAAPEPSRRQAADAQTVQRRYDCPPESKKLSTVEGDQRVSTGQRPASSFCFPDAAKPTATVNLSPIWSVRGHENYGETGMAHLLEHHDLQGVEEFSRPDPGVHCARLPASTGRPGSTEPITTSRFPATDDNLEWALAWSADAMVNSFIARKDLDSEMTRRAQRIRDGRKRVRQEFMLKRMQSMLYRLAQLRQQHDRRPQRHRERQESRICSAFYRTLLSARQRGADRRRQVRRAANAWTGLWPVSAKLPKPTRASWRRAVDRRADG
jgi:hypothetical protein